MNISLIFHWQKPRQRQYSVQDEKGTKLIRLSKCFFKILTCCLMKTALKQLESLYSKQLKSVKCGCFESLGFYFTKSDIQSWLSRLLWWLSVKESTCQCRRLGFDPCIRKIPWRRKWQPHSSILAWKIPWIEEPGRLQSTELQKSWTWLSD